MMQRLMIATAILYLYVGASTGSPLAASRPVAAAPDVSLTQAVLGLLGHEAAALTVTRTGAGGSSDPLLAQALHAPNTPGQQLASGVYAPSPLELALHERLTHRPAYHRLGQLLNPDDAMQPRANGAFSVEFARLTPTEVEFLPGKVRRTYFFEMSLTFTLLDARGRTVYARDTHNFRLHACIIEQPGACLDIVTGQGIDPVATWQQFLLNTFDTALEDTIAGLETWASLLSRLNARIELRRQGESITLKKNAAYIRNQQLADYPYLFLRVSHIAEDKLLADLQARGADIDQSTGAQLKRFLTASLHSALDHNLRNALSRSASIKQAGVFLLPDTRAIWFQDALARVLTDAVNAEETDVQITDQGEQETLASHLRHFGRLCAAAEATRQVDRCLTVWAKYGGSKTLTGRQDVAGVQYAQQIATVSGVLVDPRIDRRNDPQKTRYYPHGIADPGKRIQTVAHESPQYLRVPEAAVRHNDDRVYLRAAALAAMQELGAALAAQVQQTFREEMLR